MAYTELDLSLSNRHVAEGAQRIAEQRARMAKLNLTGRSAILSMKVLASFEATQRNFIAHRDQIVHDLDQADYADRSRRKMSTPEPMDPSQQRIIFGRISQKLRDTCDATSSPMTDELEALIRKLPRT